MPTAPSAGDGAVDILLLQLNVADLNEPQYSVSKSTNMGADRREMWTKVTTAIRVKLFFCTALTLSVIATSTVAAANYSGFCLAQFRYVSDQEIFGSALSSVFANQPFLVERLQIPRMSGNKGLLSLNMTQSMWQLLPSYLDSVLFPRVLTVVTNPSLLSRCCRFVEASGELPANTLWGAQRNYVEISWMYVTFNRLNIDPTPSEDGLLNSTRFRQIGPPQNTIPAAQFRRVDVCGKVLDIRSPFSRSIDTGFVKYYETEMRGAEQ